MIAPNLPALVSTSVATVGYVCAAFTALLARAPGMKSLRAFAVCAALGAVFATTNALAFTSHTPEAVVGYLRVGLLAAALNGASWLTYAAIREGRPLQRIEKILIGGGCLFGLAALVPGAMLESGVWIRRVEWLGISYNDAKTTPLGSVACTYYCVAMLLPLWRGVRRFRGAGAAERVEVVGLALLVLAGINDSIASLGYQTPYVGRHRLSAPRRFRRWDVGKNVRGQCTHRRGDGSRAPGGSGRARPTRTSCGSWECRPWSRTRSETRSPSSSMHWLR